MATDLGTRIREARRGAGFDSAQSLASELGLGYRTVQRWEAGTSAPSIAKLREVAVATRQPLAFFLNGDGEKEAA